MAISLISSRPTRINIMKNWIGIALCVGGIGVGYVAGSVIAKRKYTKTINEEIKKLNDSLKGRIQELNDRLYEYEGDKYLDKYNPVSEEESEPISSKPSISSIEKPTKKDPVDYNGISISKSKSTTKSKENKNDSVKYSADEVKNNEKAYILDGIDDDDAIFEAEQLAKTNRSQNPYGITMISIYSDLIVTCNNPEKGGDIILSDYESVLGFNAKDLYAYSKDHGYLYVFNPKNKRVFEVTFEDHQYDKADVDIVDDDYYEDYD